MRMPKSFEGNTDAVRGFQDYKSARILFEYAMYDQSFYLYEQAAEKLAKAIVAAESPEERSKYTTHTFRKKLSTYEWEGSRQFNNVFAQLEKDFQRVRYGDNRIRQEDDMLMYAPTLEEVDVAVTALLGFVDAMLQAWKGQFLVGEIQDNEESSSGQGTSNEGPVTSLKFD